MNNRLPNVSITLIGGDSYVQHNTDIRVSLPFILLALAPDIYLAYLVDILGGAMILVVLKDHIYLPLLSL